jgi:hypothetical protein
MEAIYLFDGETEMALGGDFEVSASHVAGSADAPKACAAPAQAEEEPEEPESAEEEPGEETEADPDFEAEEEEKEEETVKETPAEETKPVKLRGASNPEIQRALASAKVGEICRAEFEARKKKENRWNIYAASGLIGRLNEEELTPDKTVVVAQIYDDPAEEVRYHAKVFVI